MKTGILIGYFEPLHLGHLADINHATGQTDTLHVVILPKDGDSLFKPTLQDKARAVQVACGFFDFVKVHTAQSLNLTDLHGQAWAYDEPNSDTSVISLIINALHIYDNPTLFVKQSFANNLLSNTPLTIQTQQMTPLPNNAYNSIAIYQNPITHFHAIAPSAKQNYTQTVCIVGGESSGKTTLVHKLANHYGAHFVPEMGRLYTHSDLGGTEIGLQYSDYPIIANQHYLAMQNALKNAISPITIIDTDFITTQAFCQTYENRTHPLLTAFCENIKMDHTIMLDNNVKWVADGMRSLGSDDERSAFSNTLIRLFDKHQITPHMINDKDYHDRYLSAVRFIDDVIFKK